MAGWHAYVLVSMCSGRAPSRACLRGRKHGTRRVAVVGLPTTVCRRPGCRGWQANHSRPPLSTVQAAADRDLRLRGGRLALQEGYRPRRGRQRGRRELSIIPSVPFAGLCCRPGCRGWQANRSHPSLREAPRGLPGPGAAGLRIHPRQKDRPIRQHALVTPPLPCGGIACTDSPRSLAVGPRCQ